MTEAEWNDCADPTPMFEAVRGIASNRTLRLFAVACCRRVPYLISDDPDHPDWVAAVRDSVRVGELLADGLATPEDLACSADYDSSGYRAAGVFLACAEPGATFRDLPSDILSGVAQFASDLPMRDPPADIRAEIDQRNERSRQAVARERSEQAKLLRCIFGPPRFKAVIPHRSWLTSTVTGLAGAIYTDRAFDRLPILADALEEAGCSDREILDHCRQPGEHVRGCWVVDLILGKK